MQSGELMKGLVSCQICGLIQELRELPRGYQAECARCGSIIVKVHSYSRALTAAFSLAALFLYVPANIYPLMMMHYLGRETENTVWGGVRALWQDRMWGVAVIIFLASMVVPLLKLIGLFFLVSVRDRRGRKARLWIFKIIEKIGPWAMLDVFLLAIMVAVIRFGRFATVIPGPGIVAFTAVVVLTLLASSCFEPRLIWEGDNLERDASIDG
jgi:paraquat-inducible protein A